MAVAELHLELDAAEERRRRVEDDPVDARLEPRCELGDPAVGVGRPVGDLLVAAVELDADAFRGRPPLGVEDVGGEAHAANLVASRRCSRAISSSSALTRRPSRTTSSPPTYQAVDPVRGREDERGDEILGAAELEPVDPPDREVGALARLERADVVSAEHGGAAAGAERERVADGHRLRPAAAAGDEQRLLDLEEEVAALVRGGAVDAEPDAHVRVEELAHRRDPGAEPQVRGRAVRDADAGRAEAPDLVVAQVDAVRAPDVAGEPAEPLEVLDRRAAVELAAVRVLLDRLGEVRVQRQAEPARERGRLLHQPPRDRERRAGSDRELTNAPGPGSWSSPASRSVSASTASRSSTSSSGGSPPSDSPRSIEPREATMRTPSSRAACTSASTSPVRPRGKT